MIPYAVKQMVSIIIAVSQDERIQALESQLRALESELADIARPFASLPLAA
jgi:hypothetical protein